MSYNSVPMLLTPRIPFIVVSMLVSLHSEFGHASSIAVPLNTVEKPAGDLVYLINGAPQEIDSDEALQLAKNGTDISRLDPVRSDAWKGIPLSLDNHDVLSFPPEKTTLSYESPLGGATGMFRARVSTLDFPNERYFRIVASLEGHAALARAALLRRLGYSVDSPRHYKEITIRFQSAEARTAFLDKLADKTLTARERWVVSSPDVPSGSPAEVTLRDIILERAEIETEPYYWGIMSGDRVQGRRIMRALIVPLTLLDIPESINQTGWRSAQIISKSLIFTHPYADAFSDATVEDIRWMTRRLYQFDRNDWLDIIKQGHYPAPIESLLLEKIISRRNHLVRQLDMLRELPNGFKELPVNSKITLGRTVINGKLMVRYFDGYALRFTHGDPSDPMRTDEFLRVLKIEGIGQALGAVFNTLNQKILTISSVKDVTENHQKAVQKRAFEQWIKNPSQPVQIPVAAWAGPIAGVVVNASRTVSTGKNFGSEERLQLVDQVTIGGNLGLFGGLDGIKLPMQFGAMANVSVQRTYLHVRPVTCAQTFENEIERVDCMKSADKIPWKDLFVPGFLVSLDKILSDKKVPTKDPADEQSLRESLAKKYPDYSEHEINRLVDWSQFLSTLKTNEILTISDTIRFSASPFVQIPLPLPQLGLGKVGLTASVGVGVQGDHSIVRRTLIQRTDKGIQIYIDGVRSDSIGANVDINLYLPISRMSQTGTWVVGKTKAYEIPNEPAKSDIGPAILAMRSVVKAQSSESLESHFKPYELNHRLRARLGQMNLLFWQLANFRELHRLTISPPNAPDAARSLFAIKTVNMGGRNYYGYLTKIVNSFIPGGFGGMSDRGGTNPSDSILGRGHQTVVRTEMETTKTKRSDPFTTVQETYSGWRIRTKGFLRLINRLEKEVQSIVPGGTLVDRETFSATKLLELFQVNSTLIVFPDAYKTLQSEARLGDSRFFARMIQIDERKETGRCHRIAGQVLAGNTSVIKRLNLCKRPWMNRVFNLTQKLSDSNAENVAIAQHKIALSLYRHSHLGRLIQWVGTESVFFQLRVGGFRKNDESGDEEYLSDSIGMFNDKVGAGPFSDIIDFTGLSSYEVYGIGLREGL